MDIYFGSNQLTTTRPDKSVIKCPQCSNQVHQISEYGLFFKCCSCGHIHGDTERLQLIQLSREIHNPHFEVSIGLVSFECIAHCKNTQLATQYIGEACYLQFSSRDVLNPLFSTIDLCNKRFKQTKNKPDFMDYLHVLLHKYPELHQI